MNLGQFEAHIENYKQGKKFDFNISDPFIWKGDDAQVAFSIISGKSTREEILEKIKKAYNMDYNDKTYINFESHPDNDSDGEYTLKSIDVFSISKEHTLVEILFN